MMKTVCPMDEVKGDELELDAVPGPRFAKVAERQK